VVYPAPASNVTGVPTQPLFVDGKAVIAGIAVPEFIVTESIPVLVQAPEVRVTVT
jgi:hypothetical protein